jgi:hypothetical protein
MCRILQVSEEIVGFSVLKIKLSQTAAVRNYNFFEKIQETN